MKTVDPTNLTAREFHPYLVAAAAPRPIAFASTLDAEGNVNLAPFSFFTPVGSNPPTLIFSPFQNIRDGRRKDTALNLSESDEVVINMVDFSMVEQVSLASCDYPKGVDEFKKSGFTPVPSVKIKPPRVAESKAAFECKVKQIIQTGEQRGAANIIICEVILAHFSKDILDETGYIDQMKTDWVSRMGGDWYSRSTPENIFQIPKPNIHLGIGVDSIPHAVIKHPLFTGNDLGRLGNIHALPSQETIQSFKEKHSENADFLKLAKDLVDQHEVEDAWKAILIHEEDRIIAEK